MGDDLLAQDILLGENIVNVGVEGFCPLDNPFRQLLPFIGLDNARENIQLPEGFEARLIRVSARLQAELARRAVEPQLTLLQLREFELVDVADTRFVALARSPICLLRFGAYL